jgi:hypothetical protein
MWRGNELHLEPTAVGTWASTVMGSEAATIAGTSDAPARPIQEVVRTVTVTPRTPDEVVEHIRRRHERFLVWLVNEYSSDPRRHLGLSTHAEIFAEHDRLVSAGWLPRTPSDGVPYPMPF